MAYLNVFLVLMLCHVAYTVADDEDNYWLLDTFTSSDTGIAVPDNYVHSERVCAMECLKKNCRWFLVQTVSESVNCLQEVPHNELPFGNWDLYLSIREACNPINYGGNGGVAFSDEGLTERITCVRVSYGDWITGIQIKYGSSWGSIHGSTNSVITSEFCLEPDEDIMGVYIKKGLYVDSLTFYTGHRVFGPYGGSGGGSHWAYMMDGRLKYISGRKGEALDAIKFHSC